MRILFLSYFFPGPLGAMASWLAERPEIQVIFAASRSRQEQGLPNMKRVVLRSYNGKARVNPGWFELWEEALRAGKSAASTLDMVRESGFDPDIVCCATSNGSAFGLRQIFPDSFIVNFLEELSIFPSGQVKMRRALQSLQILEANLSFIYNEKARNAYAQELRELIKPAPMIIDCDFFSPEKAQPLMSLQGRTIGRELVTVFAHGLTEKELFHLWHGALLILAMRPHCQLFFIVPGAYLLKRLNKLPIDEKIAERLFLFSQLRQETLRDLLCASALAIFPGRHSPFGLLECMSCATTPLCGEPHFFLKNGWDMLELPKASAIAESVNAALQNRELLNVIGMHARQTAVVNFASVNVMPHFFPKIEKACEEWNS